MKFLPVIMLCLCGIGMLPLSSQAQSLLYKFNGQETTQTEMASTVLCLNAGDTLDILPSIPLDSGEIVVLQGISIWAQVSMGQPKRLVSKESSEGGIQIILSEWLSPRDFPPSEGALRLSVKVQRLLKVEGGKIVREIIPLNSDVGELPFMAVPFCQQKEGE
ncbi:MAG: hypothetical protein AAFR59_16885 [Bacteroidota bacterium]